jgi:hypothetical protein
MHVLNFTPRSTCGQWEKFPQALKAVVIFSLPFTFPAPASNASEHLSTWFRVCGTKSASEVGKIDN